MRSMKKIVTLCVVLISFQGLSQDPEFTQFYANPIYLNPAMAGTHGCPRVCINHRNQ
ncbi:MAG: type IX secretion system membrane protein PorP/SprF, partial [Crocinitomicaceae bacterium]|nr:type IX secretion system membrane protein PorP/SprF [Crocinitomicaceae bacterium]